MEDITNLGACGSKDALGFNTDRGCPDFLKALHSIWLTPPDVVIPPGVINEAYIKSLQMAGDLIVIKGINDFVENGNDDAIETLGDDTQLFQNKGKYKFLATFAEDGLYLNRALSSIEGHGNWNVMIVDIKGDIFFTTHKSGGYKGFTTGMIRQVKLQFSTFATGTKSGLEWQFINRYEMDDNVRTWKNENLDFDPRQVESITQVFLSLVNAPADLDVVLTVKAAVERGRESAVSGALFSQWLQTIDGATSNPTAGDDSVTPGTYILTIPALATGELGTVRLFDNSENSNIIDIAGYGLVKSNTVDYTVV